MTTESCYFAGFKRWSLFCYGGDSHDTNNLFPLPIPGEELNVFSEIYQTLTAYTGNKKIVYLIHEQYKNVHSFFCSFTLHSFISTKLRDFAEICGQTCRIYGIITRNIRYIFIHRYSMYLHKIYSHTAELFQQIDLQLYL